MDEATEGARKRQEDLRDRWAFEAYLELATLGKTAQTVVQAVTGDAGAMTIDLEVLPGDGYRLADLFLAERERQADKGYRETFDSGGAPSAGVASGRASYTPVLVRNDGDDEPGGEVRGEALESQAAALKAIRATVASGGPRAYLSARVEVRMVLDVDVPDGKRATGPAARKPIPTKRRPSRRSRA